MRIFVATLLLALSITAARAGEWTEDYKKAQSEAKTGKKLLLMDFTGSDWCGWCMKLDKEVFNTPEFKSYADQNLVLLKVDFPRKRELSAETKKQNDELAAKYNIQGYPTIIVLNSEGKKVGELGYMRGGPTAFTKKLDELKK